MAGLNGGDPAAAGRIRAAAMEAFAEHGDGASIRGIADAAGVSPGLVQHHFATKAELREAVNEHVLAIAAEAFADLDTETAGDDVFEDLAQRVTSIMREHPDALLYVARAVVDGDPGGLGIFDGFMAIAITRFEALAAEGRLDPDLDLDWAALHVVVFNLATVLFQPAIENHLAEPLRSPEGVARWHAADTELFRRGFLRAGAARG
jgi:AcrR family transcriptional regulator